MKVRLPLFISTAVMSASFLHAGIIFSNVTATVPNSSLSILGSGEGIYVADAFAFTPTANSTFNDALVDIWATGAAGTDGNVAAALFTNSGGGTPGTLLAQLDTAAAPIFATTPTVAFSSNTTTFTQLSGPAVILSAGTEYWLVIAPGDSTSNAHFACCNAGSPTVPLSREFPLSSSPWTTPTSSGAEFEIDGTPVISGTPEPATLVLFGSGLCLFFLAARTAKRRAA